MDFPFAAGPVEFVGMGDDAASNIEQLLSSILPRSLRDIEAFAAAAARAPPAPTARPSDRAQLDALLDQHAYIEPTTEAAASPAHAQTRAGSPPC